MSPRDARRRIPTARAARALLFVGCVAAACLPFDVRPPDRANVLLEGPPGSAVRLVTSNHLVRSPGPIDSVDVVLVSADTSVVELPFSRDYAIEERTGQYNFYVRASALDERTLRVRMRVLIQDEPMYERTWNLAERVHEFVFLR